MVGNKHRFLFVKYFFDKIVSVCVLIITSPIFLFIAIVLKLKGQDVFFLQKRVGYGGNDFFVYKFTTMPKGSEKFGYITTTNDSRPFKFGRFLRKTKLNEIPQLINVLNGTMSIVGPRPLVREQIERSLNTKEVKQFYSMRPGITGAGSLFYHHEDSLLANVSDPFEYDEQVLMPQKLKLERMYSQRWNLFLDLIIILLTFLVLVNNDIEIEEYRIFKI